jgi:hypothetical protein
MMSGNFDLVCMCILEGGHFSIPDADANPIMIGLALRATSHYKAAGIEWPNFVESPKEWAENR